MKQMSNIFHLHLKNFLKFETIEQRINGMIYHLQNHIFCPMHLLNKSCITICGLCCSLYSTILINDKHAIINLCYQMSLNPESSVISYAYRFIYCFEDLKHRYNQMVTILEIK